MSINDEMASTANAESSRSIHWSDSGGPRASSRPSPLSNRPGSRPDGWWSITPEKLLGASTYYRPVRYNEHASRPDLLPRLVAGLERFGVLKIHQPGADIEVLSGEPLVRALQAIEMERFCGYFMPRCSAEIFELSVRWLAVLWLTDDTMDKAPSAEELRHAVDVNQRFIVPACAELRASPGAPDLAHYVVDFFREFYRVSGQRHATRRFQRAARDWLEKGTFRLAQYRIAGTLPDMEAQLWMRRWDGAVDCCLACAEACLPDLPPEVVEDEQLERARAIAAAHVAALNDIISYEQEVASVERRSGFISDMNLLMTAQQTYGCSAPAAAEILLVRLGELVEEFYEIRRRVRRRYTALAPAALSATMEYIDSIGRIIQGNVLWSFHCRRYRSRTAHLAFLRDERANRFLPLLSHGDRPRAPARPLHT